MRYRKKPIEVEAWQNVKDANVPNWVVFRIADIAEDDITMVIRTRKEEKIVYQNDWIVRDSDGEVYPVKPSVFAKTYEPVED